MPLAVPDIDWQPSTGLHCAMVGSRQGRVCNIGLGWRGGEREESPEDKARGPRGCTLLPPSEAIGPNKKPRHTVC
jgi:hypothetical protein